jgi:hypothetical protein
MEAVTIWCFVGICQDMSGNVGSCRDISVFPECCQNMWRHVGFVGMLSEHVGTCWDMSDH